MPNVTAFVMRRRASARTAHPARTRTAMVCGYWAITVLVVSLTLATCPAAQAQARRLSVWDRLSRIFRGPSLGPAAGSGRIAGSRSGGSCKAENPPLTALLPLTESGQSRQAIGVTTAAYPTFWFYLPYALTPERPAELRLESPDPADRRYTQQRPVVELTDVSSGVIGIRWPATEMPLTVNQPYIVKLVVRCDPQDASTNQFAGGVIVRVPLPAAIPQPPPASLREQFRFYKNAGLWTETITTLAQLRQSAPNDPTLQADWLTLLAEVNLATIADQAIVRFPADRQP